MRSREQDIGDVGEDRLKRWGRVGGFGVEKCEPDRVGIDFLTHVRDGGAQYLDRCRDKSALVQVKTTTSKRARVSLAGMKRLVDSDLPAFLVVFRVDGENIENVVGAHVFHIDKALVSRVLEACATRRASDRPINHAHLKFALSKASACPTDSPKLLLDILARERQEDYATRKHEWRTTVGFGPRAWTLGFRYRAEAMFEHALGLSGSIPATLTSSRETRFGIERSAELPTGEVTLTVDSRIGGAAGATLCLDDGRSRVKVRGELYVTVRAPAQPAA